MLWWPCGEHTSGQASTSKSAQITTRSSVALPENNSALGVISSSAQTLAKGIM